MRSRSAAVEHAGALEGAGVRLRAADVLRPEPAVERDRRVDPREQRVLGFVEPGHGRLTIGSAPMRYLVTGATGKVGNAVAKRLLARGDEVVALVRDPAAARAALPGEVELATGDVTDPASLAKAARRRRRRLQLHGDLRAVAARPGAVRPRQRGRRRERRRRGTRGGRERVVHTSTFDVFHAERGGTVSEAVVADTRRAPRTSARSNTPRSSSSPRRRPAPGSRS